MSASPWVIRPIGSSSWRWASSLSRLSACDRDPNLCSCSANASSSCRSASFTFTFPGLSSCFGDSHEVASRALPLWRLMGSREEAKGTRPHTGLIDYGPSSVRRLKTRRWLGPCSARSMLRVSDTSSHPSSPKSRRCFRRRKLFGRPSVPDRSHTSTAYSIFAMAFLLLGHRLDGRPLSSSPRRPERCEGSRVPLGGRGRKEGGGHAPVGAALPDRMVLGWGETTGTTTARVCVYQA